MKHLVTTFLFLVGLSSSLANASYFSGNGPWSNQPVPEGAILFGPFPLQYLGECPCFNSDGTPNGRVGARVVMVGEPFTSDWCICREDPEYPDPYHNQLIALLQNNPVGGGTAVYVFLSRPLGDPHTHVDYTLPPEEGSATW